jgi:hypothetical protein
MAGLLVGLVPPPRHDYPCCRQAACRHCQPSQQAALRSSKLSSGLAQCTQLTALTLLVGVRSPDAEGAASCVPVPRLLRLRSLVVPAAAVEWEEGVWLTALSQLTCLRMRLRPYKYPCLARLAMVEGPVCHVRGWPGILQQVLAAGLAGEGFTAAVWRFPPAVPGAQPVSVWLEEEECAPHGRSRPLVPSPHLPGVWELQGSARGSCWSRSRCLLRWV